MTTETLASWIVGSVRLAMLALGIATTPAAGLPMPQPAHCARHEPAATAEHAHHVAVPAAIARAPHMITVAEAQDHQCPHCPASQCALVTACAGSVTSALTSSRAAVAGLQSRRIALAQDGALAHSTVFPPEPPPPQPIA